MRRDYGTRGGEPLAVMVSHACDPLMRYRQTTPIPVEDTEKLLFSALPVSLTAFHERTWKNIYRALNLGHVVHFEHEDKLSGGNVFWCRYEELKPAPIDNTELFVIDKANPFYTELAEWIVEAFRTEHLINDAVRCLTTIIKAAKHPRLIELEWPDVFPFIHPLPAHLFEYPLTAEPKRIERLKHQYDKNGELAEALEIAARCAMLEDARLIAWVGFTDQEGV